MNDTKSNDNATCKTLQTETCSIIAKSCFLMNSSSTPNHYQRIRVMIVRWQSDLINTTESVHVCA